MLQPLGARWQGAESTSPEIQMGPREPARMPALVEEPVTGPVDRFPSFQVVPSISRPVIPALPPDIEPSLMQPIRARSSMRIRAMSISILWPLTNLPSGRRVDSGWSQRLTLPGTRRRVYGFPRGEDRGNPSLIARPRQTCLLWLGERSLK